MVERDRGGTIAPIKGVIFRDSQFLSIGDLVVAATEPLDFTGSARAQSCSDATLNGPCVLQLVSAPTTSGVTAGVGPVTVLGR